MRSLFLMIYTFCALTPFASAQDKDIRKFSARGIHLISVANDVGQIEFDGSPSASSIEIHTDHISNPNLCEFTTELQGNQLRVVARTKDAPTRRDQCKVNIKLTAPRAVELDVKLGQGSLVAQALEGNVHFDIGRGDITLSAIKSPTINGRTGTGDIAVKGQVTQTVLRVGAGNVRLTYERANQALPEGSLDIKVGSGSTTVLLPEQARVQTSFRSGSGSLTNEFPHLNNAKFTISGSSGTGDMFVRKL